VRLRLWTEATRWYMSIENHDGMISTGENPWFVHHSPLATESSRCIRWNGQREWWLWHCEVFLFTLGSDFLHAVKSCNMGLPTLLPLRTKVCCGLLSPLKSIASAGFEPADLGSNVKHANHDTTEATEIYRSFFSNLAYVILRWNVIRNAIQREFWNNLNSSLTIRQFHSCTNYFRLKLLCLMKSRCILEVILNYINHPVAWGQEMTRVPGLARHLVAAINIHPRPVHYILHRHIHHTTMFYF
jgi:hypothetical protein